MGTVLREAGFSVRIYKDDHSPAHVHVVGDGIAKLNLDGPDGRPAFVWTRAQERRVYDVVARNRAALLDRWREVHGA